MINKLTGYIFTLPTQPIENAEYLAALVLEPVEEPGMLPPPHPETKIHEWSTDSEQQD